VYNKSSTAPTTCVGHVDRRCSDHPCDVCPRVHDHGIYLDRDLSMRTRVQRTVSRCFAALRQQRQIRRSVPASTFQTLVVALIHSRLDYGNSVLVGLPVHLMRRLQSVLNAAERERERERERELLIFHLRCSDHISDALICLHWLRVPERVKFKIAVLTHSSLWRRAPVFGTTQPRCRCIWSTLTPLLWHQPSSCTTLQTFLRWPAELFRWPPPRSGTHCRTVSSP